MADRAVFNCNQPKALKVTFQISKYPANTLGQLIKGLRLEKALYQKELARLLKVHKMTIVNWEMDRTKPERKYISKLADFFEMKEEILLQLAR